MTSLPQASRLTRQAGRRGWLSGRAWRRLAEAADRGDEAAIEAAWQAWLRNPGYERWRQLARWRVSAGLTELVCAYALDEPAGDAGGPGPLAAFCASHGLTPADPVRRAVFLLLTGQHAQYRAADPGGSLLALGYAAAAGPERERLRAAMAGTAGLDLVRVVVRREPRGQMAALTAEEAGFLAAQLAGRRDWPRLWDLTRNLRVPEAIRAVRMFGDGDVAARLLCGSADLRGCAIVPGDTIEVHSAIHPAAVVADLPPAEWVAGDLAAVTGALRAAGPGSAAEPLLHLLRACLEYRLGADVGIGAAAPPAARDDIALAECPHQGGDPGR
jgi:hypothetical protein